MSHGKNLIQFKDFSLVGVNTMSQLNLCVKLASILGKSRIQKPSEADNLFYIDGLAF
jgi:hypothetical protein